MSQKTPTYLDAQLADKIQHEDAANAKRVINVDTLVNAYWNRVELTKDSQAGVTSADFYLDKNFQTTKIISVADVAGSLNNKYFLVNSALNKVLFYIWLNVDSGGSDPMIAGRTGVEVQISSGDSAEVIAVAIRIYINSLVGTYFTATSSGNSVTITNKIIGATDQAVDGNTGFAISTETLGESELLLSKTFDTVEGYKYIYNEATKSFELVSKCLSVDELNSTDTPLVNGGIFYGSWVRRTCSEIIVAPYSDTNFTWYAQFATTELSTTVGLPIYTAGASAGIDSSISYSYTAGTVQVPRRLLIAREYYRIVVVNNSGSNMTTLRLQSSVGVFAPLTSKLNSNLAIDADAEVVRAVISGEVLDDSLNPTGTYDNVQLTSNNALKVNQVGEVIFQYIRPDDPQIPSGSVPTINQVLNTESNVIDSGWLPVREFSAQAFHIVSDQNCKVYILNSSDNIGSNWNGFDSATLNVVANNPANLAARFFDDYFRVLIINDSGNVIDGISARSTGSNNNVQPIDISIDQPVFSFFPAPLVQAVQKGEDPNGLFTNARQGGAIDVTSTVTPLGISGVFDTGVVDCRGYTQISSGLKSDQEGTLVGTWYADEAGTQSLRTFTVPYVPNGDISWFSSVVFSRYIKLTFTNGTIAQTEFYYSASLDVSAKHGQMLGLESFVPSNALTNVNRTIGAGKSPDGLYENIRSQGLHSGNTTNIPLNANEIYRGTWFPIQENYIKAITSLSADASGVLYLDVTNENTPTDGVDTDVQGFLQFTYDPTVNPILRIQSPVQTRWVRHRYVNGPAAQATFNLEGAFVISDPGLSSQPLRVLPSNITQVGIVRSVNTIPSLIAGEYQEIPIDGSVGNPTVTVTNVRDDLLLRPSSLAQANQIVVGTAPTRIDSSPLSNRREVVISNEGPTSCSVGFSNGITYNSNSVRLSSGASRTMSLASSVALWAIAQDTGGTETILTRSGASASGTATSPSNALTSDDLRASISANAQTVVISGYTAGTTNSLVSVKIGVEGRKQSGQFETVVKEEVQSGSTAGAGSVTSASLAGGTNQLYVAYITRNASNTITQVLADGVFLTPLVIDKSVGGRTIDVWYGYGDFAAGVTTASMSTSTNAHISVYRFSNADPSTPIQDSGFTTGSGTTATGPTLNKTAKGYSLLGVSHEASSGSAGAGYTEDVDLTNGSGSNTDSIGTESKALVITGTEAATYTLNSSQSWYAIGVTISPATAINPQINLSYKLSAVSGATSGTVVLTSTTDTSYKVDITGDRSWVFGDIVNVETTATGSSVSASAAQIDQLFVEVVDTTGAVTRLSILQTGEPTS